MKTKTDIEKQLGVLHSTEKEELESVIGSLNQILNNPQVNIELIDSLEDIENTVRIMKAKFYRRLLNLLKTNHMV